MSNAQEIVNQVTAEEPTYPAETYYDTRNGQYLLKKDDGSWLPLNETQFKRQLIGQGYRGSRNEGERLSPADAAIVAVQLKESVDYAGPLAGWPAGRYRMCGQNILVTTSALLPTPEPGHYDTIADLLESLFCQDDEYNQVAYFLGWLKVFISSLRADATRPGQALILAGPKDCGKSLLQRLLSEMTGQREAKPYQYAIGETTFNADHFQAEHLVVEDEAASFDMRMRRKFGVFIKGVAANEKHRLHGKNRNALMLMPRWRLSVSVNSDPEHLMVLPPLDESLLDKVIVLKCSPPKKPFNNGTHEGREKYWKKLKQEIPAFLYALNELEIDEENACSRFGVKAFIHPEIAEAISELSDEARLLNLIDMTDLVERTPWVGSAKELERCLRKDDNVAKEAERLLKWSNACGVYLGRLAASGSKRVERAGRVDNCHQYKIWPVPADLPNSLPFSR